ISTLSGGETWQRLGREVSALCGFEACPRSAALACLALQRGAEHLKCFDIAVRLSFGSFDFSVKPFSLRWPRQLGQKCLHFRLDLTKFLLAHHKKFLKRCRNRSMKSAVLAAVIPSSANSAVAFHTRSGMIPILPARVNQQATPKP